MKLKVTLEIEVTKEDYLEARPNEQEEIDEPCLIDYVENELGWVSASFTSMNIKELTVIKH